MELRVSDELKETGYVIERPDGLLLVQPGTRVKVVVEPDAAQLAEEG